MAAISKGLNLFTGRKYQWCFYCGAMIDGEGVYWRGLPANWPKTKKSADIALHVDCCIELVIRLMRDVHAIECKKDHRFNFEKRPDAKYC